MSGLLTPSHQYLTPVIASLVRAQGGAVFFLQKQEEQKLAPIQSR